MGRTETDTSRQGDTDRHRWQVKMMRMIC
jgi:hypothetical protein